MKIEHVGAGFFFLALVHTFLVSYVARFGKRFQKGSAREALLHLLSEVEIVFGFWAFLFLIFWACISGPDVVIQYQQSLNMTEPLFIFCVMIMAATRPVIQIARAALLGTSQFLGRIFKIQPVLMQFFTLLTLGPLLGSLITEPAAITITALLLYQMIKDIQVDSRTGYGLLGLLFVNISVGGALTHFAAPPILIVARTWGWSLGDVFVMLGEAALTTVFVNTLVFSLMFKKQLRSFEPITGKTQKIPVWISLAHVAFLGALVLASHYPQVFFGIFLAFIGLVSVTKFYQDDLKFKESFLVAFFLAGLIVFGAFQRWWLEPLLMALNDSFLYLGAIGLTAVTDNAALTYLGSQVSGLSDLSKWALVSGALAGGGLSILANAPNPAGYSILGPKLTDSSLNAFRLLKAALLPTLVALICFYVKIFLIQAW